MTDSKCEKSEGWESEFDRIYPYNEGNSRLEHIVPSYDEDDEFVVYVRCALVPSEIKAFIRQQIEKAKAEARAECIDAVKDTFCEMSMPEVERIGWGVGKLDSIKAIQSLK
jgi:hypothetical protein